MSKLGASALGLLTFLNGHDLRHLALQSLQILDHSKQWQYPGKFSSVPSPKVVLLLIRSSPEADLEFLFSSVAKPKDEFLILKIQCPLYLGHYYFFPSHLA